MVKSQVECLERVKVADLRRKHFENVVAQVQKSVSRSDKERCKMELFIHQVREISNFRNDSLELVEGEVEPLECGESADAWGEGGEEELVVREEQLLQRLEVADRGRDVVDAVLRQVQARQVRHAAKLVGQGRDVVLRCESSVTIQCYDAVWQ